MTIFKSSPVRDTSFEIFMAMSLILLVGEFIRLLICLMFSGKSGRPSICFANSFVIPEIFSVIDCESGMMILFIVSPFSLSI